MKVITKGKLRGDVKSIEFCCDEMVKKVMIKGAVYHDCGHLWSNQNIIKFCEFCGEPIQVERLEK